MSVNNVRMSVRHVTLPIFIHSKRKQEKTFICLLIIHLETQNPTKIQKKKAIISCNVFIFLLHFEALPYISDV